MPPYSRARSKINSKKYLEQLLTKTMSEIVLIGYGLLATIIAGRLLFRTRLTKGHSTEFVHFSLERIRNVGELNVLTAHLKEVVTLSSGEGRIFKSNGKILLICG